MEKAATANKVVNLMYANDAFSKWLGIEILEIGLGLSKLKMTVREEMVNGFGIAHGGISYSFADSALAFASNSHGRKSMSIETSVSHVKAIRIGDVLTCYTTEVSQSNRLGVYNIEVFNQKDQKVALFKGMVYRTDEVWKVSDD